MGICWDSWEVRIFSGIFFWMKIWRTTEQWSKAYLFYPRGLVCYIRNCFISLLRIETMVFHGKFQGGFSVTETLQVMRPASSTTIIWRITWTGPMILKALAKKMNQKHTALILGSFFKKKTSNTFLAFFWCFLCDQCWNKDITKHHLVEKGVVQLADGSYAANCLDDRFWIAPACRADTTSCILTLTAGSGGVRWEGRQKRDSA